MAWNDDAERIASVRGPHGATRGRAVELRRELTVRACLAERDRPQQHPHLLLELGALGREREIERGQLSREVRGELRGGAIQDRRFAHARFRRRLHSRVHARQRVSAREQA